MSCSTWLTGVNPRALAGALLLVTAGVDAEPAPDKAESDLGTITVIGITPSQGATLPEYALPYNVQSAGGDDFERSQALDVSDYLNRRLAGVSINSAQGNPLQPDVQFRGFTGTPLLGGSEGISVYVDGVRVNEVFGDSVNWDLIPEEAMSKMTLLSGANPIFGLNTLGGAVQIQTKNGFTEPGTHAQTYGGSFRRFETTVERGANDGRWGYYLLANRFDEAGWRDLSRSSATSFLGTLSWRGGPHTFDLHLSHSETDLIGNGAQAIQALQASPTSVFTSPDRTQNNYSGVTAQGIYQWAPQASFSATAFARQGNTRSYNGDATSFDPCSTAPDILCETDGSPIANQNGSPLSAEFDAINNIGLRRQLSYGGSLQAVFKRPVFGLTNQLVAGLDYGRGRADYRSVVEASFLVPYANNPDFSFGTQPDTGMFVPADALAVHVGNVNAGFYLTDTVSLTGKLSLTGSVRYNRTHTTISDRSGFNPDLDGDHAFHRINPAVGLTYQASASLNVYAGYSESTRAPTPVELTCATPDSPCKLPNQFLADPELRQVIAKGIELGLRGQHTQDRGASLRWHLGWFRTTNVDDIIFQSTGGAQSNEGFYANVGDTRRQGVEAAISGKMFTGRLEWYANYTHLEATFRTAFLESSANNPNSDPDTGLIQVRVGNRIPGLPRDSFKFGVDYQLNASLSLGADLHSNSGQYYRGDESNLSGQIAGYRILNAHARYWFGEHFKIFARLDNVFDRRYDTFGILGDPAEIFPNFTDARFLGPGAPRAAWLGVSMEL